MHYDKIKVPYDGEAISVNPDHSINVPDRPIIPYVVGDGIGIDVTPVMKDVVDAAVKRSYGDKREIAWMRAYAGAEAAEVYGSDNYLPDETIHVLRHYVVSIKGPLTTPISSRSLRSMISSTMSSTSFMPNACTRNPNSRRDGQSNSHRRMG